MVGCLAREAISLEAFAIIFAITCQNCWCSAAHDGAACWQLGRSKPKHLNSTVFEALSSCL